MLGLPKVFKREGLCNKPFFIIQYLGGLVVWANADGRPFSQLPADGYTCSDFPSTHPVKVTVIGKLFGFIAQSKKVCPADGIKISQQVQAPVLCKFMNCSFIGETNTTLDQGIPRIQSVLVSKRLPAPFLLF